MRAVLQWRRTSPDGASECLTLCTVDGASYFSGWTGRETPYVVQVTTGPSAGDDFVGLFDLDGERIALPSPGSWAACTAAPDDVIAAVVEGWSTGLHTCEVWS